LTDGSNVQEQEQNKTEKATPFKLEEARKHGQVAKSLDFNTLVVVCGLLMALMIWGASRWEELCELCARLFAISADVRLADGGVMALGEQVSRDVVLLIGPFVAAAMLFAALANVVQTGFIFSTHPLKPQFERINPVAGFKRIFNQKMSFEAFKSVLKLCCFAAVTIGFFLALWPKLPNAATDDVREQLAWLGSMALALLFRLGLVLLVVGILDLSFTRWQFARQMRMSRRELKDEVKRREGDPLIRQKIRELQRENAKQARSMSRLPEADVLITNPTHFAIALHYVRDRMDAPIVIAKGADKWAAEMRKLASTHGVPIMERRRLARELFRKSRIDQPIPLEAFVEVARVYAELGRRKAQSSRYEAAL
jgi:flagellar biosynthetic protein FlhB